MTRTPRVRGVAALAITALAGYLIAATVLSSRSRVRSAPRSAPAVLRVLTGPPAPRAAEVGAVAVAAAYLRALEPESTGGSPRVAVSEITSPPLTAQAVRAHSAAAALTERISAGGTGFARGWQLGWRLLSANYSRARVAIWAMGIVAAPSAMLAPDWSTTVCTLRWADGGWRVQAASTIAGPTPPVDGSDRPAVVAFARAAQRFEEFTSAP
jgi:hypothetical protein